MCSADWVGWGGVGCRRVTERGPIHIQLCPLSVTRCEERGEHLQHLGKLCFLLAQFCYEGNGILKQES